MTTNPNTTNLDGNKQQGKRDTEGRPVLTDKDEEKRREEEAREKPVDPE